MSQRTIKPKVKKRKFHPQAVRHAKDVDLSKADPKCERCDGSGMLDAIEPDESMKKGGINEPVPVVCRCVTQNGGVSVHPMMKLLTSLRDELKTGVWASSQLKDLRNMNETNKKRALAYLRNLLENEQEDEEFKKEAKKILETIEKEEQERVN